MMGAGRGHGCLTTIGAVAIGLVVLFIIGTVLASLRSTKTVVYLVDGTARNAMVTITTPSGITQLDASLPLSRTDGTGGASYSFRPGSAVYISAQNQGEGRSVTCHIRVNGVEISVNTASGAYTIATCSGTA